MVAGEPGGGEPAMRAKLEEARAPRSTEAMGIGDISVSLWGEGEEQAGMHFSGRGFVHFELIDPTTGQAIPVTDGATGELVLTHLKHRARRCCASGPVIMSWSGPRPCRAAAPRRACAASAAPTT